MSEEIKKMYAKCDAYKKERDYQETILNLRIKKWKEDAIRIEGLEAIIQAYNKKIQAILNDIPQETK